MIDIEMKISYFNAETDESVEFTSIYLTDATDMNTARRYASEKLGKSFKAAYDEGAMMDTFYYEYDFLVPQSLLETA